MRCVRSGEWGARAGCEPATRTDAVAVVMITLYKPIEAVLFVL